MKKYCARCQRRKPLAAFARHAGRPDGRQSWCRQCTRTDQQRRYARQRGWVWVEEKHAGKEVRDTPRLDGT